MKSRQVRFVTPMFLHQSAHTGCPAGEKFKTGEQGRFVTAMSKHQVRDTGFLARRERVDV